MNTAGAQWMDAQKIRKDLISDGWFTPDTYDKCFRPISEIPAVYLFMLRDTDTFLRGLVAYVGMSTRLQHRLSSHNILPMLEIPGYWAMRWFKPVSASNLRKAEQSYITKFEPPWNIAGRKRGVNVK